MPKLSCEPLFYGLLSSSFACCSAWLEENKNSSFFVRHCPPVVYSGIAPLVYLFIPIFLFMRPCCPRCSVCLSPIHQDSEAEFFRGVFIIIIIIYILSPIIQQSVPVSQIGKELPQRSRPGLDSDATRGCRKIFSSLVHKNWSVTY